MRFLFLFFILLGCQTKHNPKPSDTILKDSDRDWEALYARELNNALKNEDVPAFYFFWPLYLKERFKNKCQKYNEQHNINCECQK